mgnify:CR=1 FL=1
MKVVKIVSIVFAVVFVGIQFVPTSRNQSNVIPETDILTLFEVPERVGSILKTSCYDCHSNNTVYPWYNKIQPTSWFLERHIQKGKDELNFNEFGTYSSRRQKSKLKSIGSQIAEGEMPLLSYTLLHGEAKLSESDKEMVIAWVNKIIDSL